MSLFKVLVLFLSKISFMGFGFSMRLKIVNRKCSNQAPKSTSSFRREAGAERPVNGTFRTHITSESLNGKEIKLSK